MTRFHNYPLLFIGTAILSFLMIDQAFAQTQDEILQAEMERRRAEVTATLAKNLGVNPPPQKVLDHAMSLLKEQLQQVANRAALQAVHSEKARRDRARIAAAGEIGPVLQHLAESREAGPELLDRKRFEQLLGSPITGPNVGQEGIPNLVKGVVDGTQITLPAGTVSFPRKAVSGISGVRITGAGADKTTISGELHSSAPILLLKVKDCSLTGQDVFEGRSMLVLTLQGVRAAGYNTGAGGSSFLDVRSGGLAVHAIDCTFDGTVGRGGRQHGTVFSLSADAKLLRFDNCTFVGNGDVARLWGKAALRFENCVFIDNARARIRGATYVNCRFEGNGDVPDGSDPDAQNRK